MCQSISAHLREIWRSVNPSLPIVTDKRTVDKLINAWNTSKQLSIKTAKISEVEKFDQMLDNLFDLCKCKCKISTCVEFNCSGCDIDAHVNCTCLRMHKIPLIELKFICSQRNKTNLNCSMQIGPVDHVETKRQGIYYNRRDRKRSKLLDTSGNDTVDRSDDEFSAENESDEASRMEIEPSRNYMDVSKVSAAAIRMVQQRQSAQLH